MHTHILTHTNMHERMYAHARTRTPVFSRYIILVAGSQSDQDEVLRLSSLNRADAMKELVFRLPLRRDDWLDKFVVALEETGNPAALESLAIYSTFSLSVGSKTVEEMLFSVYLFAHFKHYQASISTTN